MLKSLSHNKRMPRIVVTGPPGAGKTTVVETYRKSLDNVIHCVPEAATMIIEGFGIIPGTLSADIVFQSSFQNTLYRMQHLFEDISEEIAKKEKRGVLLFEKGRIDIAAHLKGGAREYEKLFNTTIDKDYGDYDLVLFMEMPKEKIYNLACQNKPSRIETYKQAKVLEKKVRDVWKRHPNFLAIPDKPTWEERLALVQKSVTNFLKIL